MVNTTLSMEQSISMKRLSDMSWPVTWGHLRDIKNNFYGL